MTLLTSWRPIDVAISLLGVVVLLLIISALTSATPSVNLANLFAFDAEGNVVTGYAIILWLFLALILRLMAAKYRTTAQTTSARAASVFSYLALFFAIDEASGLSLKIRLIILDFGVPPQNLDQDQIWIWLYGLIVLLIVAVATPGMVRLSKVSPKFLKGMAVGAVVFGASAIGLEIVPSLKSLSYEPVLEETLEMVAVIIMIWGALHGLGPFAVTDRRVDA